MGGVGRRHRWERYAAFFLATALCALVPAGAGAAGEGAEGAEAASGFSFAGEARALSVTGGGHGSAFGVALSRASLLPRAAGAGAGLCKVADLGAIGDLPCVADSTQTSRYPGAGGKSKKSCSAAVSNRLPDYLHIRSACGRSASGVRGDRPFTESTARVPILRAALDLGDVLPIDTRATAREVHQASEYLTGVLAAQLGIVTPKRLSKLERGVGELVAGFMELARKQPRADLIKIRMGRSSSTITPEGSALTVVSTTSGARVGVLPVPRIGRSGAAVFGDPLRDGLLVIDVGGAAASAQVDPDSASSAQSASSTSASSVTVRIRDLSKTQPRYVEIAVAEGESVTVLEGTPWQSTITAGSAFSEKDVGSAAATTEPAHLALLSDRGGPTFDFGATRAVADLAAEAGAAGPVGTPRGLLPATGGARWVLVPLLLGAAALAVIAIARLRAQGTTVALRALAALRARGDKSVDMFKPSVTARRRAYRTLAALLAVGGIGLFSYPLLTDLWAARIQESMTTDFSRMAANYVTRQVDVGDPLTRLVIPRLNVDTLVVEGITPKVLQAGAGHYPMTPLPGQPGNVAIAGHRTSFGSPFARIDELMPGDQIVLVTPVDRHIYKVLARPSVADPDDWSIITDHPEEASYLTLTSCHPEGSDAYRIWVRAELVTSTDGQEVMG